MSENRKDKLEQILNELKNRDENISAEQLLLSKLTPEQSEKLKSIISSDEAVKNFLSGENAQKIINQLKGKGD